MTEKYTDLTEEIWRTDKGLTSLGSVEMVLDYLDRNPDRVPGRTITESDIDEACSTLNYDEVTGFKSALDVLGVIVVPDPEPTNAERLAELIREIGYDIRHNGRLSGSNALALDLDARGVKAPVGDDD